MYRKFLYILIVFGLIAGVVTRYENFQSKAFARNLINISVNPKVVPEADDFATLSFGNAWDMDQFLDISHYLNGAGRHPTLTNISVVNGIFSARSIGDSTASLASFYPLFPGYAGFMQIGNNLGSIQPVDTSLYDCAYIAMKVNSPPYVLGGSQPDVFRIVWYEGQTMGVAFDRLYPETALAPFDPPVHNWRLYKINLASPKYHVANTAKWQDRPTWSGMEINPTIYKDIDFQIDWIRFTNCSSENENRAQITWSPDASVNTIWARPAGTQRNIQLVTGIDGSKGSYQINTNGLAPGAYQIGVGTLNTCCTQWANEELTVDRTPIVKFVNPSPISGRDYASAGGNPWDMDPTDITKVTCSPYSFQDGILNLETLYPSLLSSSCRGPGLGEADPRMYLNMPTSLSNAKDYRYLSFRHNVEGSYAIPADGMIGRFIWKTSNGCTQVSADIPYDVGWHTYMIDLYDPVNGTPVEAKPNGCPLVPWSQAGEITQLRFDPNENWTGNMVPEMVFNQKFDWFSLTKTEQIGQGQPYTIGLDLNKPAEQINDLQYFYTTDRKDPFQNKASKIIPDVGSQINATNYIYLPGLFSTTAMPFTSPIADVKFDWDTTTVAPGTYYICVKAIDDHNESTFCSLVPVIITDR